MIELSNTADLTLAPGETATFDTVLFNARCNKNEYFVEGGSAITILPGVYRVFFNANIAGTVAATPVEIAICFVGNPILGGTIETTPAGAIGDPNAVSRERTVAVPIGGGNFTIKNPSTTATVVIQAGSSVFHVERRG